MITLYFASQGQHPGADPHLDHNTGAKFIEITGKTLLTWLQTIGTCCHQRIFDDYVKCNYIEHSQENIYLEFPLLVSFDLSYSTKWAFIC